MSFDIFGQPLKRGHCEAHPHVNEEWPCSLCLMESEQRRRSESNNNAQHDMILEVEHLKMQRDELLSALEDLLHNSSFPYSGEAAVDADFESRYRAVSERAISAIAKAKGGAA